MRQLPAERAKALNTCWWTCSSNINQNKCFIPILKNSEFADSRLNACQHRFAIPFANRRLTVVLPTKKLLVGLTCLLLAAATRIILSPVQQIEATVNLRTWILYGSISEHIHAISACIFLVLSACAIAAKKASKAHRLFGKLSVTTLIVACISASILLAYLAIQDTGNMYNSLIARNENMSIFLMLLLTGVYGGLAGYRWAAFSHDKHDIDIIFGLIAISISLLGIAMTPLVAFIAPLNTLNDAGFPLTPFMAGLLLICQSLLMLFFGVDDLSSFHSGQISYPQRIKKHVYRVMTAAGAAVTAVFIVHLGPLIAHNSNLLWSLYIIPPTGFAVLSLFVMSKYQISRG